MSSRLNDKARSCESFIICWLDVKIDHSLNLENFRQIINIIEIFTNPDECVDYMTNTQEEKIFFIVSDLLAEQIIPLIHDITQVQSIYVFCYKKPENKEWIQKFSKINGVFADLKQIYLQLQLKKRELASTSIEMSFLGIKEKDNSGQRNQQEANFMYLQVIKSVFIGMKDAQDRRKKSFQEVSIEYSYDPTFYPEFVERMSRLGASPIDETHVLVEFCRDQYKHNPRQLELITEFEQTYEPSRSIWWYSRPTFLYEILNKALRVQDIATLYRMRFLIVDLHRKLIELHDNASYPATFTVYRGQGMSNEELEKLIKNCGGLLSVNSFLSTTTDRHVALGFALVHLDRTGYAATLFEICIARPTSIVVPFANISSESFFQGALSEAEILFSIGAVMRIQSVDRMSNGMWKISLTMTDEEDQELRELIRKQMEMFSTEYNARALGWLLFNMGDYDQAEYFFQIRLDELLLELNEKSFQTFLKQTAESCKRSGIPFHTQDTYDEHRQQRQLKIGALYNDLGLACYERYDYEKALFYYRKALGFEVIESSFAIHIRAVTYTNISLVYSDQENYYAALENLNLARIIMENDASTDLVNLAKLYCNIGSTYYALNDCSECVMWVEKGLKLQMSHLPPIHPAIGSSYKLIGQSLSLRGIVESVTVNEQLLKLARQYMEKADYIYKKTLPPNHRDLLANQRDIEFLTGIIEKRILISKNGS